MKGTRQPGQKKKAAPQTGVKAVPRQAPKNQKPAPGAPARTRVLAVAAILALTFIAYFPSLHNNLLKTWDDQAYVAKNELVKSLSSQNIMKIFREDKGQYANYHPLTTLSLAVNYHFSKEEPFGYHLTNLLLHLLNTLLVFIFIYLLARNNLEIAAFAALLFGLNPMHVESVAWISERKDVLYAFFFLASMITYLLFVRRSDWKWYIFSIVLFICSILSKAMAASLPLALILVGFMEKRKWSWKLLPDKVPYVLIAILLGLYAIRIQAEGKAIGQIIFPFFMRVLHAAYGYTVYLLKITVPVQLSAFYPYPYPLVNSSWITNQIPAVLYLTLIVTVIIFLFSLWCIASGKKDLQPLGFGLLFYASTIALVLQFLPVGRAIMADRYAYIPSIGVCYIIAHYAARLYRRNSWKIPVTGLVILYAGFFFFQAMQQTRIWKDDETLWDNVIRIYPSDNRVALAYANRAQAYQEQGKTREALQDYLLVSQWNPKDENALDKIGKIYGKDLHDLETSIKYFNEAHRINPAYLDAIIDLATAYGIKGRYDSSLVYSMKGLAIDSNDAFLLFNAGITYSNLGRAALGKAYMDRAVKLDPSLKPK